MRAKKCAEAEIHGVAERQQAGLAKQHVVGQRENDRDAHLRQHGQRKALGEHERQRREEQRGNGPEDNAAFGNDRGHAGFALAR